MSSLPYHCPTLKADYFKSPCAGQVAAAKNRRHQFPHAVMPYGLEQCLKCGGEDLITREAPPADLTVQKEESMSQVHVQVHAPAQMPEAVKGLIRGQFCKNHPGVESKIDKRGHFMGLCLECLKARAAENNRNRGKAKGQEKMTPAVARDLGKKATPPPLSSLSGIDPDITGGQSTEEYMAEMRGRPLEAQTATPAPTVPTCNNHPDRPAKIDKLGRSMSLCVECLSTRGRKAGIENHERGLTAPPVSIPLNQAKYVPVREWIEAQAEENERTLQQQIMFLLKMAMRAEAGG